MKKLIMSVLSFAMMVSTIVTPFATEKTGDDAPYYYVALGDSIAAGFNLPGMVMPDIYSCADNYKADLPTTYPHIVADALKDTYGYKGDVYDTYSNMSLVGATLQDCIDMMTIEDFYVSNQTFFTGYDPSLLQIHDLYVGEIAKADIISVNCGNNDLITNAIYCLLFDGVGGDGNYPAHAVQYKGVTVYDDVANPIIATMFGVIVGLSMGQAMDFEGIVNTFKYSMEYYMSDEAVTKLTVENVKEGLEYLSSDHLKEMMVGLAQAGEPKFDVLIETIQSINEDAELYIVNYYTPFGNSLTLNGVTYDNETIMKEVQSIMAKELIKHNYFTGATVEEYLNAVMEDVCSTLAYPLAYLTVGTGVQAGVDELNAYVKNYCEKNDLEYVDVYDIPNEENMDPHPDLGGHEYIADQLIDAMTQDVTVEANAKGTATVTGPSKLVSNAKVTYQVAVENGYSLDSVVVNGQVVEVTNNTFEVKSTKDTLITVNTTNNFPFTDVPEDKWYYSYVKAVYELGLMTGTSETTFRPSANITRGQLATILHRMEGCPEVSNTECFPDVAQGKFYTEAIAWCKMAGVVNGNGDGTFRPANNVTRQELAIMLRNYAAYCGEDVHADVSVLDAFPDASSVSGYAKESVAWAVANGLISGSNGNLNPKGNATRGQAAKMILATNDLLA